MGRHLLRRLGRRAHDEFEQAAVLGGARAHQPAGPAVEGAPKRRILAQVHQRIGIAHAEPPEDALGGVARARDLAAPQVEVVCRERFELRADVGGSQCLGDRALRQLRRVRHERRDGKGDGPEAAQRDQQGNTHRTGVPGAQAGGLLAEVA